MTLVVHHLQVSQSERIVWLCEELGLDYTLKTYKRSPLLAPPELKALHPMGAAPVIQDGEITLAETPACAEYIITKHGEGRLALPPSHKNYADYLYWFHFANSNLQAQVSVSFRFRRSDASAEDGIRAVTATRLVKMLQYVDDRLSRVPWLAGDDFTAADVMSVFSLTTMRTFIPFDLSPYPNILAWLKRVGDREPYQRAMRKGDPDMRPALGPESPEELMTVIGMGEPVVKT